MPDRVFVDTAGWANLFISSESHHQQATSWFNQARQQGQEMVTTNYTTDHHFEQAGFIRLLKPE